MSSEDDQPMPPSKQKPVTLRDLLAEMNTDPNAASALTTLGLDPFDPVSAKRFATASYLTLPEETMSAVRAEIKTQYTTQTQPQATFQCSQATPMVAALNRFAAAVFANAKRASSSDAGGVVRSKVTLCTVDAEHLNENASVRLFLAIDSPVVALYYNRGKPMSTLKPGTPTYPTEGCHLLLNHATKRGGFGTHFIVMQAPWTPARVAARPLGYLMFTEDAAGPVVTDCLTVRQIKQAHRAAEEKQTEVMQAAVNKNTKYVNGASMAFVALVTNTAVARSLFFDDSYLQGSEAVAGKIIEWMQMSDISELFAIEGRSPLSLTGDKSDIVTCCRTFVDAVRTGHSYWRSIGFFDNEINVMTANLAFEELKIPRNVSDKCFADKKHYILISFLHFIAVCKFVSRSVPKKSGSMDYEAICTQLLDAFDDLREPFGKDRQVIKFFTGLMTPKAQGPKKAPTKNARKSKGDELSGGDEPETKTKVSAKKNARKSKGDESPEDGSEDEPETKKKASVKKNARKGKVRESGDESSEDGSEDEPETKKKAPVKKQTVRKSKFVETAVDSGSESEEDDEDEDEDEDEYQKGSFIVDSDEEEEEGDESPPRNPYLGRSEDDEDLKTPAPRKRPSQPPTIGKPLRGEKRTRESDAEEDPKTQKKGRESTETRETESKKVREDESKKAPPKDRLLTPRFAHKIEPLSSRTLEPPSSRTPEPHFAHKIESLSSRTPGPEAEMLTILDDAPVQQSPLVPNVSHRSSISNSTIPFDDLTKLKLTDYLAKTSQWEPSVFTDMFEDDRLVKYQTERLGSRLQGLYANNRAPFNAIVSQTDLQRSDCWIVRFKLPADLMCIELKSNQATISRIAEFESKYLKFDHQANPAAARLLGSMVGLVAKDGTTSTDFYSVFSYIKNEHYTRISRVPIVFDPNSKSLIIKPMGIAGKMKQGLIKIKENDPAADGFAPFGNVYLLWAPKEDGERTKAKLEEVFAGLYLSVSRFHF